MLRLRAASITCLLLFIVVPCSMPASAGGRVDGAPARAPLGTQQPSRAPDGAGGAHVAWLDVGSDIRAQRLLADGGIARGSPLNGVARTGGGNASAPTAIPDGAGGLLVVFARGGLYVQRFNASGSIVAGFPREGKLITSDFSGSFAATTDGAGGAYILRLAPGAKTYLRARLTRIGPDGAIAPGWSEAGVALAGTFGAWASRPQLQPSARGGVLCTMNECLDPEASQSYRIACSIRPNGRIAQQEIAAVHLSDIYVPGAGLIAAGADEQSVIGPSGAVLADGPIHAQDAAPALSLEPARPNPSSGPVTLSFVLPSTEPARLELFDVSGRRVHARTIEPARAGPQLLPVGGDLTPGVYLARIIQGGHSASTRFVRTN